MIRVKYEIRRQKPRSPKYRLGDMVYFLDSEDRLPVPCKVVAVYYDNVEVERPGYEYSVKAVETGSIFSCISESSLKRLKCLRVHKKEA